MSKVVFFGGEQLLVFHFPKWNIQTSSKIIFCLSRPVEFEMIQYVCVYAAHTSFSHTTAITIYQCKQNAFTLNYRLESITIQLGLALFSLSMKWMWNSNLLNRMISIAEGIGNRQREHKRKKEMPDKEHQKTIHFKRKIRRPMENNIVPAEMICKTWDVYRIVPHTWSLCRKGGTSATRMIGLLCPCLKPILSCYFPVTQME